MKPIIIPATQGNPLFGIKNFIIDFSSKKDRHELLIECMDSQKAKYVYDHLVILLNGYEEEKFEECHITGIIRKETF